MAENILVPVPRDLRSYAAVDAPKLKKDYEGQLVRVNKLPPTISWDTGKRTESESLIPEGSIFTLRRRYPVGGQPAALVLDWPCPCCGRNHERNLTEDDITSGNLEFVTETGWAEAGPSVVYLACPYTHPDAKVRQDRWLAASDAAAWLMGHKYVVLSPISMGHPICVMDQGNLGHDFAAWERTSLTMLDAAEVLVVLVIDGVSESTGVRAEMEYARQKGIPIYGMRKDAAGEYQHPQPIFEFSEVAA